MIQDIAPKRMDMTYLTGEPREEDLVFCFLGGEVLLNGEGWTPRFRELPGGIPCRYLFSIDDTRYFMGDVQKKVELAGFRWESQRALRGLTPMDAAFAGFTAQHLAHWYRSNRFCGCCGGRLEPGTDERKLVCPACGNLIYPRINPAVIVAVTDGDRLLMTRYAHGPVTRFVLVAGFVEVGETAEQTVAREVLEETGVRVKHIRYFGSQPWGCAGNLTLGYWAELEGGDTLTVEESELCDAKWFPRSEIPVPDDVTSLTSAMIRAFANGEEREG